VKLKKELSDKTYQNYVEQHPAYKDFFHNVIAKDKILYKIWCYTYLPAKELKLRGELKKQISDRDRSYLHERVIKEGSQELIDLHNEYSLVENADQAYLKPNLLKMAYPTDVPLTIEQVREILRKVETKTYYEGEKKVFETKIHRYFPILFFTERQIGKGDKIVKIEAEIEYVSEPAFREKVYWWEKFSVTDILQKFRDMSEIQGIIWNLDPKAINYSIILSHKGKKRELPLNLLHRKRYCNLVRKAMRKYRLESSRIEIDKSGESRGMTLGIYDELKDELNFSDAVMAVLNFSSEYDEKKHGNFPGYLGKRIRSHLRDIRRQKQYSTTQLYEERKEIDDPRGREATRILNSDLEFSEGSLYDEVGEDDEKGEEGVRRIDLIPDKSFSEDTEDIDPEKRMVDMRNSLTDSRDRMIFTEYYEKERPETQIAEDLGITQQAISKRIKQIKEHLIKNFRPIG
jgi:RNA polymerase sigma factor (sigma-70 family)